MRRFLITAVASLCLLFVPAAIAQAATFSGICSDPSVSNQTANVKDTTFCNETNRGTNNNTNPLAGPNGIFTTIISIISIISAVAAVILIIIGALQYVLAAGDPSKVNQAKNYILYAIIGLVVTVIARGVIAFILNKL